MTIKLKDLLDLVPRNVEEQVRATQSQTRSKLHKALSEECNLVLRSPEELGETRQKTLVPIQIKSAYPNVLQDIEFADEIELFTLISQYRPALEQTHEGILELLNLHKKLSDRQDAEKWASATDHELRSSSDWIKILLKRLETHDPLEKMNVDDDILGVYQYRVPNLLIHDPGTDDRIANWAQISLYWAVIGLMSSWIGCAVEDLTVVALTHELAHAYTQLGADLEGKRWPVAQFREADVNIKEGLAQYYTERVLQRLSRVDGHSCQYARALAAYEKWLPIQTAPYQRHHIWLNKNYTPEVIRLAILKIRRQNAGTITEFESHLASAHAELNLTKRTH